MSKKLKEWEDDWNEQEFRSFEKFSNSKKSKIKYNKKGSKKRSARENKLWNSILEDVSEEENSKSTYKKKEDISYNTLSSVTEQVATSIKKEHIFSENTREIKGIKIDYNGISSIEKIDSYFNGNNTFGIKFVFKGNKGYGKVIWFNQNKGERERVFIEENNYFSQIKK